MGIESLVRWIGILGAGLLVFGGLSRLVFGESFYLTFGSLIGGLMIMAWGFWSLRWSGSK